MGYSTYKPSDWKAYEETVRHKPTEEIFKAKSISRDLDPVDIKRRESRDSAAHPVTTPLILAFDVTGSMEMLADHLAKRGLGPTFEELIRRGTVPGAQLMVMGIGDPEVGDRAPFQATQFESDSVAAISQIERIWLEKGGGPNMWEGYLQAWYFAAFKTDIDSFRKRGKKGFLFTIGDEQAQPRLRKGDIKRVFGDTVQDDMSAEDLLQVVSRTYEVFHVVVEQGRHARAYPAEVRATWTALLGQRVLFLSDHTKLPELVVSAIEVVENGRRPADVAGSWSGSTSLVIAKALGGLARSGGAGGGSVRL
jgi:hypothetical protein